ncbi:MAG: hypothetical protein Q9214_007058 [Letrouitia sp. 1 TL-2023]
MAPALSTTKRKFDRILESISNPSTSSSRSLHHDSNASSNSNSFFDIADFRAAKRFRYTESMTMSPSSSVAKSSPSKEMGKTVEGEKTYELPNFAPHDRELFLKRLKTFRDVDKWISKPVSINEVEWAKRGWTCVGKDKVGCVGGCGAEVMIILENDKPLENDSSLENDMSLENGNTLENGKSMGNSQSLENDEALKEDKGKLVDEDENTKLDEHEPWLESTKRELVEKYKGMIVSEHEEGCMWRRRGCDGIHFLCFPLSTISLNQLVLTRGSKDTIHRIPFAHRVTTFNSLRQRYESLAAMATDLPSNISPPPSLDLQKIQEQATYILQKTTTTASAPQTQENTTNPSAISPTSLNPQALILSLFGWQPDPSVPLTGILTCPTCFRRLGLWVFKSPPPSPPQSANPPSSSPSPGQSATAPASPPTSPAFPHRQSALVSRLDPLAEHREYCPWINPQAQSRYRHLLGGEANEAKEAVEAEEEEHLAGWKVLVQMLVSVRLPSATEKTVNRPAGGEGLNVSVSDEERKKAKDRERWASLKKAKEFFRVKSPWRNAKRKKG